MLLFCMSKHVLHNNKVVLFHMTHFICMTCTGQVKGGAAGLCDGAEVLLGPDSELLEHGPEQQFISQKMRPGSGVLSIQVLPDGPTRVLQVK